MWHHHSFSQRNKATKKEGWTLGEGVGQNLKEWGGNIGG